MICLRCKMILTSEEPKAKAESEAATFQSLIEHDYARAPEMTSSFMGESFVVVPTERQLQHRRASVQRMPSLTQKRNDMRHIPGSKYGTPNDENTNVDALNLKLVDPACVHPPVMDAFINYIENPKKIEGPICINCFAEFCTLLDKQVRDLNEAGLRYERMVKVLSEQEPEDIQENKYQIVEGEIEEDIAVLKHQIESLTREANESEVLEEDLLKQLKELESELEVHYQEYNQVESEVSKLSHLRDSTANKLEYISAEKAQAEQFNPWVDTFPISKVGSIGTINGLRLGRLPGAKVDWSEINAGLGQMILLLHTISTQSNFKFSKYNLHPCGSTSTISDMSNPVNSSNFYYMPEVGIPWLFTSSTFDRAMSWFLECVDEMAQFAMKADPQLKIPARIKGNTVQGVSALMQGNQDEQWTFAMLCILSILQRLLHWLIRRSLAKGNAK